MNKVPGESSSLSRPIGDGVAGSLKLNISAKSGISWSNSTRECLVLSFNFQLGVGSGMQAGYRHYRSEGMDWCGLGVAMGMYLRLLWRFISCFLRRYTSCDEQFQLHPWNWQWTRSPCVLVLCFLNFAADGYLFPPQSLHWSVQIGLSIVC